MPDDQVRPSHISIITPDVRQAYDSFVESVSQACADSGRSRHEVLSQINSVLNHLWDACQPLPSRVSDNRE